MPTFGERLKELRISKHIKQTEMAEILGIKPRNYQNYEYNKVDVPSSKIIFLADYFDVSTDYLLCRTNKPK